MYCSSWCRYRTYQYVAANYPVSWGVIKGPERKYAKFGPINPHGTAFAPKQWLYEKEATGMESSKLYCASWCRYRTYQCLAANHSVSLAVV